MCGIIICDCKQKAKIKLQQQVKRWLDSFGVIFFQQNTLQTFKQVGTLQDYLDSLEKHDFQDLFCIHHRDATIGEVNYENAHPFIGKKFTLCHNGMVKKFHELYVWKYQKSVDSWNMLEYLEEYAQTIEQIPERLQQLTEQTWEKIWIVFVTDGEKNLIYTDGAKPSYFEIEANILRKFANFWDEKESWFFHDGYVIFDKKWSIFLSTLSHINTHVLEK